MTVQSELNKVSYVGDGETLSFPITVRYFVPDDIDVYINGEEVNRNIYSISGNYDSQNALVNLDTPPSLDDVITIKRNIKITQEVDLLNDGDFDAEIIERSLDKLTMIAQDNKETLSRGVLVQVQVSNFNPNLPVPSPLKYLRFNSNANKIEAGISQTELDTYLADIDNAVTDIQTYKDNQNQLYQQFLLDSQASDTLLINQFNQLKNDTITDNNETVQEVQQIKAEIENLLSQSNSGSINILNDSNNITIPISIDRSLFHSFEVDYIINRGALTERGVIYVTSESGLWEGGKVSPLRGDASVEFSVSDENGLSKIIYNSNNSVAGEMRYLIKKWSL